MKLLSIVESAYRGTVEEQDDTTLWLLQSMRTAGADLDILLRGNAVNYALEAQKARPVHFGVWTQHHVADVVGQLTGLLNSGARVFVCAADITDRGLLKERLLKDVVLLTRLETTQLFERYDRILAW